MNNLQSQLRGIRLVPNFVSSFIWCHRNRGSLLSHSSLSPSLSLLLMHSGNFASSSMDEDRIGATTTLRGEQAADSSSPDEFYPLSNSRPRSRSQGRSPESISNHSRRSHKSFISEGSNRDQSNREHLHFDDDAEKQLLQGPPLQFLRRSSSQQPNKDASSQVDNSFLDKFKLGVEKSDNNSENSRLNTLTDRTDSLMDNKPEPPQDAEEIFKKMKETGLIPNAVAMLDGLCKDGLIQEAMNLFGLMREKGTIPEVVIYTAVVEGFCKSQKLDDAIRIFRKMQNNGIKPNAFSYTVLIQGMYKCNKLDDAVAFCFEMLESGHSPNVATFVWLVDGLCKDKGVEEARSFISILRQKGFFLNEKSVREFLDKKAPFSSMVWEAVFGKKSSQKPF